MITFQRGELNANKDGITGTPAKEEGWTLDMTGNWPGYVQKTSSGTDLDQGRTHNPVNEITAITAAIGTNRADPAHDRAGNMTTIPKPANLADGLTDTYDAWNRLVEVKDGEAVIARYEYDGLNRRIKSHIDSGAPSNPTGIDTYVHHYYNSAWQILETRQTDSQSAEPESLQPKHQYVWSQRYIDAAVLRDENTGANGLCDDQRLYYLNDANFNVTALVDISGDSVERYVYAPYGAVTIHDATWTNTHSASSYANLTLYTGRELDPETGLYYYRNRYYSAALGRFVSRDPIGYDTGEVSRYHYVPNVPTLHVDATGLGAGGAIGYPGDSHAPPTSTKPCCNSDSSPGSQLASPPVWTEIVIWLTNPIPEGVVWCFRPPMDPCMATDWWCHGWCPGIGHISEVVTIINANAISYKLFTCEQWEQGGSGPWGIGKPSTPIG